MQSFGAQATGARLERMRASPRWDGAGFRNLHPVLPGLRDASVPMPRMTQMLCAGPGEQPAAPLPSHDPRGAWARPPSTGLRATWLGHSTVLIEIDGARVLTDPVWGTRASPFRLMGPRRFQPMPVRLHDMPVVDAVLISHDHYDHLDYPTITALAKGSAVPFITSLGVGAHLQAWGVAPERITELDWWESARVPGTGVRVTAAPSQHFSGRSLKVRNPTLWSSLVIEGDRHRVFFSGDTGLTGEYADIAARLGPFDLTMLEIGAYYPAWGDMHLGPANALKAQALLGSGALLPVHWGTFRLAPQRWDEPIETLVREAGPAGVRLVLPQMGEAVEPTQQRPWTPWWRGTASAAPEPAARPVTEDEFDAPARLRGRVWPLD